MNDGEVVVTERRLGQLPIMVGSSHCHLSRMSIEERVRCGEEVYELGGYFICNGLERLIRLLQVPRRHVIMAIDRSSFTKRGPQYTSLGCQIKCVREDMSSVTLTLHYLRDGRCNLRWSIKKQEFLVPVVLVLKALKETSDRELYEQLIRGDSNNTFLSDRLELLLRESKNMHMWARRWAMTCSTTKNECLAYLGARFRILLDLADHVSDVEAGQILLDRYILVHLHNNEEKFLLLLEMIVKLYRLANDEIAPDNPDSLNNHVHLVQSSHA